MSKAARDAMNDLVACKAKGICERDKLVNVYLAKRIEVYERRMQTVNEHYRAEADLPRCPPVCDDILELTNFEEVKDVG